MTDISQQRVQSEQARETILGTRTAIYVSLAVFLGFAFLDPWANPSSFSALLMLRGLWCGALLVAGVLTHLPWAVRYPYALSNVACLMVGSGCIVLASIAGGDNHPYHDALLLTIFGWSVLVPLRIRDALLTLSLLVVFSNVVIVAVHGVPDIAPMLIRNAIYITACTISCVSASLNARLRQTRTQSVMAMAHAHTSLRELDETKSQFFANVSHELRTPLTLIIAPVEAMLRSPQTPAPFLPQLKICHRGALRLLRLVDDILALTRLQSTRPRLRLSPCKLVALVGQLTEQVQPWAERKGLTLTFAPTTIPNAQIECDEAEIERLILNLLGNAVKFTSQGGSITIAVDGDGEGLHLSVRDTGMGIAAAAVDKIFDPYYQVDTSNERRSSGTGLGLSLCKSIVELHGGRIWVESAEGVGTTMHVWLTQVFSRERLAPRLRETLEIVHSGVSGAPSEEWQEALRRDEAYRMLPFIDASERRHVLRGPKKVGSPIVLMVEDNVDMQQFVSGLLSDTYEVYCAYDGAMGLQMARNIHPDIIISDIMMPVMDGFTLARALREDARTSNIPIVLLTARAEQRDKMTGHEVGVDAYLPKPFDSNELRLVCERLVKRKDTNQRATRALYDAHQRMFIAEVSHEILNPLNFINTAAFVLHRQASANPSVPSKTQVAQQAFDAITEGVTRVRDVVSEMRLHIEGGAQAPKHPSTAQAVIDRTLRLLGHTTQCTISNTTTRTFMAQRGQVEQVLVNLVLNAQQASSTPAQIALVANDEADAIAIAVVDRGPGIPAQDLAKVFEPYFTTKAEGTGLGLAISRQIMQEHGGDLAATLNPEGGMTFKLILPAAADPVTPKALS